MGILEGAGIEFFLEGGTLLGAYRNGQFIYHAPLIRSVAVAFTQRYLAI